MEAPLPAPRQFLTSLFNTISTSPAPPSSSTLPIPNATTAPPPLRSLPPAYKPLLTTLHVLFPSLLLPALDLLDRRLVTRVIVTPDTHGGEAKVGPEPAHDHAGVAVTGAGAETRNRAEATVPGPAASQSPPELAEEEQAAEEPSCCSYYLVRSAQAPRRHHPAKPAPPGQIYVVRPQAWNCTCAAFAFSAFPGTRSSSGPAAAAAAAAATTRYEILDYEAPRARRRRQQQQAVGGNSEQEQQSWEFGGLSTDGLDVGGGRSGGGARKGGVPCCKHLLACVLAERWAQVLGGYVEERYVGMEEGAGLLAEP